VLSKLRTFLLILAGAAFIGGCGVMMSGSWQRSSTGEASDTRGAMMVYQDAMGQIDKLEFASASAKLEQIFEQFESAGDTEHSSKTMFWLGFCYEKLAQDDLARQAYVLVIEQFPNSSAAELARTRLNSMNQP
jgi:outer membrane protein assembly factor BamD (BamD/ComL family)